MRKLCEQTERDLSLHIGRQIMLQLEEYLLL